MCQLENVDEDEESKEQRKGSAERIVKGVGAEAVYEREITLTQYQINIRSKRKDLKSANVKNLNQ